MKKSSWLLASALLLAGLTTGCATSPAPKTVADVAASQPQLSTLSRLLDEAGMASTLRGAGPYTVFAPSDEAFKALPQATLDSLAKDKERLKAVLSHHVVSGSTASANVANGEVTTLGGSKLALSRAGSFVTVEEAMVTQADVASSNGVVHVIDRVLMPPAPKK